MVTVIEQTGHSYITQLRIRTFLQYYKMFVIKSSENRNFGVFAEKDLNPGALVMREKPLLELKKEDVEEEVERLCKLKMKRHHKIKNMDAEIIAKKVVKVSFVIQQFVKMSAEQKAEYLGLYDAFQYISNKRENFELDLEAITVLSRKNDFQVSQEHAAKIWGIFNTNNFENGVYHSLSRVNHSCEPNSEFVWNNELQTQDLRALKKIYVGEEITANYADVEDGLNREYRQDFLLNNFMFVCQCSCCSKFGQEAEEDENLRQDMMMLHHQLNNCDSPQDIVKNINRQLKVAKMIGGGVKLQYCLNLLNIGHQTVAQEDNGSHKNGQEVLLAYATRAHKISSILYGPEYCVTKYWQGKLLRNINLE